MVHPADDPVRPDLDPTVIDVASERPTRRRVLGTAGLVALAGSGLATACGSQTSETSRASPATVAKADVPVGGGLIVPDAGFVVTQPEAGTYRAFSSVCTHQGCKVGTVENRVIEYPCHGSKFSIVDGSVANPPADRPLPSAKVTASGDNLVISS